MLAHEERFFDELEVVLDLEEMKRRRQSVDDGDLLSLLSPKI